jgi:2-oxoglutarate ferredoxin oxidoreductase subunit gamma
MYQGIIMAGFGGQGIVSGGIMLAYTGMMDGKNVTFFPAYGAEMRGGTANCSVIISTDPVAAPVVGTPDSVLVMNEPSLAKFEPAVRPGGTIFLNTSLVNSRPKRTDVKVIEIKANEIAEELGSIKCANMVMLGAYAAKSGAVKIETLKANIKKVYPRAKDAMVEMNKKAIEKGAAAVA